jgi:hypothetical protein
VPTPRYTAAAARTTLASLANLVWLVLASLAQYSVR